MMRTRTRQSVSVLQPRRRSVISFLRRTKREQRNSYREAAAMIRNRRPGETLRWIAENLRPEAARMLETCLSTYGPNEALRWISYWEEKREPIEKKSGSVAVLGGSMH